MYVRFMFILIRFEFFIAYCIRRGLKRPGNNLPTGVTARIFIAYCIRRGLKLI